MKKRNTTPNYYKKLFCIFTIMFMTINSWGQILSDELACPEGNIVSGQMVFNTENFTIVHAKGTSSSFAVYSPWRVYINNDVTFIGGESVQKISSVVITASQNANATRDAALNILEGAGTVISTVSGSTVTFDFSGNVTSFTLTPSAQTRWSNIIINYEPVSTTIVSKPTIFASGAPNGVDTFWGTSQIEIQTTTPDATIYYTTDGSEPTTASNIYTAAFNITATSTVKAIAVADGLENSAVEEKSINITPPGSTSIPYSEAFNNTLSNWYTYQVQGTTSWGATEYGAQVNGHNNNTGNADSWLISPKLENSYPFVNLLFDYESRYGNGDLQIMYSTNYLGYGDPSSAIWIPLPNINHTSGNNTITDYYEQAISTEDDFHLAFVYQQNSNWVRWSIKNLEILPPPTLVLSPESLTLSYIENNGPSDSSLLTVSGDNLAGNTTIKASEHYEVSTVQDGVYDEIITLTNYTGTNTSIYVRLKQGLSIGTYTGSITANNTEVDNQILTLNGSVKQPVPVIESESLSGVYGQPFSEQLSITNSPTAVEIVGNNTLPTGLIISNEGLISGTPSEAGVYTIVVKASNSGGDSENKTITINIDKAEQTATFSNIVVESNAGTITLIPENTNQNIALEFLSGDDAIVSISGTTATVSGATGVSIITVSNNGDVNYKPFSATFTITVTEAIITPIVQGQDVNGTYNQNINYQIVAENNPTSYSASNLPQGLVLNTNTGIISGVPEEAGTFNSTVTASNSAGASPSETITFIISKIDQTLTVSNISKNTNDASFTIASSSNEGIDLDYNSSNQEVAIISGTTIQILGAGITTISLSNDGNVNYNPLALSFVLTVKEVPTVTAENFTLHVGNTFSHTIVATNNPTSFSISENASLPEGLLLSEDGVISGEAITAGVYTTDIVASLDGETSIPVTFNFTIVEEVLPNSDCFVEDFTSAEAGHSNTTGGSSTAWIQLSDNFTVSDRVYQAGGAVRLGAGSNSGSLTTVPLETLSGTVSVSFDVKGWTSVEGSIKITLGSVSETVIYTNTMSQGFQNKEVTFANVLPGSTLKIETTSGRAFIDNLMVCNVTKHLCEGSLISDLNLSFGGDNNQWYLSGTSSVALEDNFELVSGVYYRDNVGRFPVNVVINPIPEVPVIEDLTVCGSAKIEDLDIYETTLKFYVSATAEDTLPISTLITETTTLFVSSISNGCESERSEVQITINMIPSIPTIVEEPVVCGSKLLSELALYNSDYNYYADATTYTLLESDYSFASTTIIYVSQTINGCESSRAEVEIVVNTIPEVPVIEDLAVCESATIEDLDIYEETLRFYVSATSEESLSVSTPITETTTFFVSSILNGCESARAEVEITVNAIPEVPVIEDLTVCGSTKIEDLEIYEATLKFYMSATSEESLPVSTLITETTTFFVSSISNGCESARTEVEIIVNAIPEVPVIEDLAACESTTIEDLDIYEATLKFYVSATSEESLSVSTPITETTTFFVSSISNGCESERTEVEITVNAIPEIPVIEDLTVCGSTTIEDLDIYEATLKFYVSATSEESLPVSKLITETTTYFVSSTLNGCESSRTEVEIIVNAIPEVPVIEDLAVCESATIEDLDIYEETLRFYASNTSEESLSVSTLITETTTYFVSSILNGCESERTEVEITVNTIPEIPVIEDFTVCGSTTIEDLDIYEETLKFYVSATSEESLPVSTLITGTTTYFISSIINGCESARTEVEITINAIPVAPSIPILESICGNIIISNLTIFNPDHKYYADAIIASSLSNDYSIEASTTLYVSQIENGCESERVPVSISIKPIPNAPVISSNNYVCETTTLSNLDFYNSNHRYYTSVQGGTELESTHSIAENTTFYVSQIVNSCESVSRTAVNVQVLNLVAPQVEPLVFCGPTNVINLPQGNNNYKWYENQDTTEELSTGYSISQSTVLYVSIISNGCESSRTAVNVTINPIPNAPSVTVPQPFCGSVSVASLPQGNGTYVWYLNSTIATPLANSYSFTSSTIAYVSRMVNGCESLRTPVSLTIINIDQAPNVGTQTFCGSATVFDLPQGNGIYKWYSTATSTEIMDLDTPITATGTLYVANVAGTCESLRKAVAVYVSDTTAPQISSIVLCEGAAISDVEITSATNTTIHWYASVDSQDSLPINTLLSTGTYFIGKKQYGCDSERAAVSVTVNSRPSVPTGMSLQSIEMVSDVVFPTVSDLEADQNGVVWFATAEDARSNTNPLLSTMPLENNKTYFGVLINEFGCVSSEAFAVTVTITLSEKIFEQSELVYYPNPVNDVLNITYSKGMDQIVIYSLRGQKLGSYDFHSQDIQLDLSTLSSGVYMIQIVTGKENQFIKIIKN